MAGLSDQDVQTQIEHMINFIKQEADEIVDEERTKTEELFNVRKQEEVEAERKRIRQDYERKHKQVEIEKKITHSNAVNQNRLRVLKAREDAVDKILDKTRDQIVKFAKGKGYSKLLQDLIIQGALALQEDTILIQCRKEDVDAVNKVLDKAKEQIKNRSGVSVDLTVDNKDFLPKGGKGPGSCSGGVVLTALKGAIRCDNTLDTRLSLAFEGMLPQIRVALFGRSESRKHDT